MKHAARLPGMLSGVLLVLVCHAGCSREGATPPKTVIRVGHLQSVTHAQALVAHALSRQGKGWFETRLGPGVEIEWSVYNAGPRAMEAIFTKSIDLAYVGPSPALNAYSKSVGREIRIIAGAAEGGAALVVQGDGRIKTPADFRGKRVGTPQLGNTQDVACRSWLQAQGFKVTQAGGDVTVLPVDNPDQLSLFQQKELDAVWTVEPWVSRLELEAGGKVFLEEEGSLTTVLASGTGFLEDKKELARAFVKAHDELTEWVVKHPEDAQRLVLGELETEVPSGISQQLLGRSWNRLRFTKDIEAAPLEKFVAAAKKVGFLRDMVDLSKLVQAPQ